MFDRLITLIGNDKFEIINKKKILLVGVGGVGTYALEALVRNGFFNITIIDPDIIDISNLNRQLITNQNNLGLNKVDEAIKRAKSINPNIKIDGLYDSLNKDNIMVILSNNYDYIIDACDTIETKYQLMKNKSIFNYKLISCMGTAKKLDPTKLSITTLEHTFNDPIARILRRRVKKENLKGKFNVISSIEEPANIDSLGSNNMVPSVAGLYCVYYILNDILK